MRNTIQAADRMLQLLEAFRSEGQHFGVSEWALRLGVHKSTVSRLASTLVQRGFLEQDPSTRSFRLGPEMSRLGALSLGSKDLLSAAQDAMARLARETGETINLGVPDGHEILNIAQVDGPHIVGIGSWTGRRTRLHPTSNGKVLLAFGVMPIPQGSLPRYTARTITDHARLEKELGRVRKQGWACAVSELEDGLHSVAVPVLDAWGKCRAALSVAGPEYRMAVKRFPALARQARLTAKSIGLRLGMAGWPARTE